MFVVNQLAEWVYNAVGREREGGEDGRGWKQEVSMATGIIWVVCWVAVLQEQCVMLFCEVVLVV